MTESIPAGAPAPSETHQTQHYQASILSAYDAEIAAGIGPLMQQLDPSFSDQPVPKEKMERIISSDRCQIVATNGEYRVGSAATMNTLMDLYGNEGWLEDFVTDASVQRAGLGSMTWDVMEEWCRTQGLTQFSFGTETFRPEARKFYAAKDAPEIPNVQHLTQKVDSVKNIVSEELLTHYSHETLTEASSQMVYALGDITGRNPDIAQLEAIVRSDDRGQLVITDIATNKVMITATMNTLMGAGKQNEGWMQGVYARPDAPAAAYEALTLAAADWCKDQGLTQYSFAAPAQNEAVPLLQTKTFQDMGADLDPEAIHLTRKVA
jgi:GNAT superfamily N-acetyltransferase